MRASFLLPAILLGGSVFYASAAEPRRAGTSRAGGQADGSGQAADAHDAAASQAAASQAAANLSIKAGQFDSLADGALEAMRGKAEALKVGGVAVVAYIEGEKVRSWTSKMLVVGRMKDEPGGEQKSSNLLAIAYAKASEMADTLRDSGSKVRPPMTGEFGWEGGAIVRIKGGYLLAAFSGGKSADDLAVSRAGVAAAEGDRKAEGGAGTVEEKGGRAVDRGRAGR